jgi:uncharacterized phosphosugar-binding protein
MSADLYFDRIIEILEKVKETQRENIRKASEMMADAISHGRAVYTFGSGHSVLPAQDVFPRYGTFVGFQPILDSRLMWFNILGPGGVKELLWLERTEGYIKNVIEQYPITEKDVVIIYSHGGLNPAPVEMAIESKKKGAKVIAITSLENQKRAKAIHSSGKKLSDIADITIDNGVPPEDALIEIEGRKEKISAGSTVLTVAITMALVAETGKILSKIGKLPPVFMSPNICDDPEHNNNVFKKYWEFYLKLFK